MDSRPSGPERWISVVDKPPVWSAASAGASAQAKVTCVPRRPRRLVRLLGSEVSWATSRLWGPAANQTGVWLRLFPFVFHSGTPSERRLSYVCERTNTPIGEPASNPRPPPPHLLPPWRWSFGLDGPALCRPGWFVQIQAELGARVCDKHTQCPCTRSPFVPQVNGSSHTHFPCHAGFHFKWVPESPRGGTLLPPRVTRCIYVTTVFTHASSPRALVSLSCLPSYAPRPPEVLWPQLRVLTVPL